MDRQSAFTLNTNNIQKQIIPPQKDSYKLDSTDHIRIKPITNLSHSPGLCNNVLQELNLNGLCQYSKSHKAYIFEKSNHIVNSSHLLIFLRQSMCYVLTQNTHQWYKINANEILRNHKLVPCDDQSAHMVLLPPVELPEIARLTLLQVQD